MNIMSTDHCIALKHVTTPRVDKLHSTHYIKLNCAKAGKVNNHEMKSFGQTSKTFALMSLGFQLFDS